jgi:hypothetical protein
MIMSKEKYIESPELLWTLFIEYQQWVKDNPYIIPAYDKSGVEYNMKKPRPYSLLGFEVFLHEKDLITDLKDYVYNTGGRYDNFEQVIKKIRLYISSEQIDGALAGLWKENLVSRINGITEKTETEVRRVEQPLFHISSPEMKQITNATSNNGN